MPKNTRSGTEASFAGPGNTYLYGGKPAEVRSAAGIEGVLVRTFDGEFCFRVYYDDGNFTDYEIRHSDLSITIDKQELAALYRSEGRNVLDHAPEMLGLEKVREW